MRTILVTGGAGFVGAHFARVAHDAGHRVVVVDDLSTTKRWPRLPDGIARETWDVGDRELMLHLLVTREVGAIVHFAGRICVEESFEAPALYFEQNLERMIDLLDVASGWIGKPPPFILSSSAAVYGHAAPDLRPISPYGASKLAAETALASFGRARGVPWAALRYFNAAGAHPDGTLRENHDPETHLLPRAIDAGLGRGAPIAAHRSSLPTRDGTCVRDYVHVMDLADAHLAALEALDLGKEVGSVDIGSGRGASTLEVLDEVGRALGRVPPYSLGAPRRGDPPELVAEVEGAAARLGWTARRGLEEVVADAVRSRRP